MLIIVAAVVAANLPFLLDFSDPNPLGPRSGLTSAVVQGPAGGQITIDPNNGYISQALSHRAALDLLHLRMPWWNSYAATGMPLAGEMQSAAFFPLTVLTLLSNGQLYEHILLEIVAGLSTYLLLRRISINRWASAAAGVAFALNGTFAWFSHAAVNPVAFLPLLLLGVELAYDAAKAGRRGGWWLIAVSGALSFYAGFPEVAYIDGAMAVLWFAWRCGCLDRRRLLRLTAKGAAGVAVGTALSAPLLVAMVDDLNHADLGVHASSFLGFLHLPAVGLPQLVLPYVYGPIFDYTDPKQVLSTLWGSVGGYLTASLLMFALLGLFSRGRRGLRLILLGWALLVFARIYDAPHALTGVLGVLPGMSHVTFYRYATASLELSVIILAALGLDDVARAPERRRRVVWCALAVLPIVVLAAVEAQTLIRHLPPRFNQRPYYAASIAWALVALGAAVLISFLRDARLRVRSLAVLFAVDAFAMFVAPEASAPRAVQLDLTPVAFLQRHEGSARFFTLGPLQPNYGSYFGLASLNVNDFPPSAFADYVRGHLDQAVDPTVFVGNGGGGRPVFAPSPQQELLRNLRGYRDAGVSYVLTPAGQALPQSPSTFTLVFRSPSTWIYRLAGAKPYFSAADPGCSVTFESRESARLSCSHPTALVRLETYAPGWSAEVDGHPVRVGRADGLFQTISVPAGSHHVRFSYAPLNIDWAYLAFVGGFAWLLFGAVLGRSRPSRQ